MGDVKLVRVGHQKGPQLNGEIIPCRKGPSLPTS